MISIITQVVFLGKINYDKALDIQEKLLKRRQEGKVHDILLLLEHPPVLTLGRNGNDSNILLTAEELSEKGILLYNVGRGGDVTYHGPGQIVGYPIFDLSNYSKDLKKFVWNLEEVFIRLLKKEYNITAHRKGDNLRGVWVKDKKITAVGIAVKHWVTMHGFAFNVNTRLEHFQWINPCGITDKGVTSLQELLGQPLELEQLNRLVIDYFCDVFDIRYELADLKSVLSDG